MVNKNKQQTLYTHRPPLFMEVGGQKHTDTCLQEEGACYKIGKIGKPHGIKGEVTLMFDDDVFDRVDAEYLVLELDGILVPFFMEEYRFRSNESALIKFCDVDTQEQAKQLTGCYVYFPRYLSDNSTEDLSWAAIVTFQLIDFSTQQVVGEILSVDDSTMNILFEVKTEEGKELLIPASEQLIKEINMEHRKVFVELPQGILDLD